MWEIRLGDVCDSLEIIVTCVTEVCSSEAEKHGHGAAIAAFILQEICSMFGTHLKGRVEKVLNIFKIAKGCKCISP